MRAAGHEVTRKKLGQSLALPPAVTGDPCGLGIVVSFVFSSLHYNLPARMDATAPPLNLPEGPRIVPNGACGYSHTQSFLNGGGFYASEAALRTCQGSGKSNIGWRNASEEGVTVLRYHSVGH